VASASRQAPLSRRPDPGPGWRKGARYRGREKQADVQWWIEGSQKVYISQPSRQLKRPPEWPGLLKREEGKRRGAGQKGARTGGVEVTMLIQRICSVERG